MGMRRSLGGVGVWHGAARCGRNCPRLGTPLNVDDHNAYRPAVQRPQTHLRLDPRAATHDEVQKSLGYEANGTRPTPLIGSRGVLPNQGRSSIASLLVQPVRPLLTASLLLFLLRLPRTVVDDWGTFLPSETILFTGEACGIPPGGVNRAVPGGSILLPTAGRAWQACPGARRSSPRLVGGMPHPSV
jgi:hypothetical protein